MARSTATDLRRSCLRAWIGVLANSERSPRRGSVWWWVAAVTACWRGATRARSPTRGRRGRVGSDGLILRRPRGEPLMNPWLPLAPVADFSLFPRLRHWQQRVTKQIILLFSVLSPSQIRSRSKNLREFKFFKFNQIYIAK